MSVCLCVCYSLSGVWLLVTPWTAAHQAPLSMEFPLQEYWSGLPFTSPGEFSNPAIDPRSPTNHLSHQGSPRNKGKEFNNHTKHKCIKFVWRTENYMILVFSLCVCVCVYIYIHIYICIYIYICAAKLLQSCPTLCDPMDCSLPGSSIPGVSQAGILEWVAISFSRGSSYPGMEPASPALQENTAESPVCACVHAKSLQLCPILCDPVDCSPQLLCPWDSPGQNIGLGCHALFQGIFPTQGLNLSYISCIGRHANGRHSLSCHQECTYYLLTHKTNNHKAHLRYFVFFWWTHLDVLL